MRKPIDTETQEMLQKIGARIKELRKKQFANYEHFAYEHDLNRVQYGRYEQGQDMKLSSFFRVLKALDISIQDFFGEEFEKPIS